MNEDREEQAKPTSMVGLGVALGSAFGVAFGSAFGDVGTGLVLGMVLGMVIGACLDAQAKQSAAPAAEEEGDVRAMSDEAKEGIEGLEPRALFRAALGRAAGDTGASGDPALAERAAEEEASVRAEIEKRLPGLELIELLGRGGMGYVYRARQPKLDREVALKVVAPGAEQQAGFAERFAREAQAMARLSHPNVVTVHDYGQDGSFCWLLMEYVDGSNLRDVIRGGKLEPAEALALVPKICDALQYAHDQGVVHRDVKPENILLDRDGGVKIADFGLAKLTGTGAALASLTGSQQVLGTFRYMAPEQLDRPLEVDHRADIYSLGVVFYEMLTGEIPMGSFDPPSQHSAASPEVDDVVLRALAKEPERRYQQASEVKSGLESIGRGEGRRRATTATEPTAGESAPRLSLLATGAAALSGVGALPFVLSVGAFLVARLNSVDEVVPGDAPVRVSFAGVFMVGLFVVGLALLFAGGSQGFRALDEIRNAWPRRYGAALAVFGAWAGVLLGANAAIMVATFGFWDVPGELNGEAPGFTALILLAADVAFLVWYRLRFVLECRAE